MRAVGVFLIFLAVLAFMGAVGMDTSVPTETGRRVHNIGLMRYQENAVLLAVGLFLGGVIFFALGGKNTKASPEKLDNEPKKCPFCAELIKAEAIKCRFCGSDLPKDQPQEDAGGREAKGEDHAPSLLSYQEGLRLTRRMLALGLDVDAVKIQLETKGLEPSLIERALREAQES